MSKRRYFKPEEFECKCGCRLNNVKPELVAMLEIAREFAGVPFIINSACRCEYHNKQVGGKETSSHLYGLAVDIRAEDSRSRKHILYGLMMAGFKRVGIAKSFIHADIDTDKDTDVCWVY